MYPEAHIAHQGFQSLAAADRSRNKMDLRDSYSMEIVDSKKLVRFLFQLETSAQSFTLAKDQFLFAQEDRVLARR